MGHPSRDGQQATDLEDLEPREEKWAGDVDLGDGRTQVCGFQVFLVLESQLETTETKPFMKQQFSYYVQCTGYFVLHFSSFDFI